ncbi:hypothetical protein EJD97_024918 [Solanum chilense]|uniref:Uncharacterized protein n=1 Tax=Solanum chilense TaxID=4083 RepID=A0A6N2C254_SOLCI|nr:hypothetical protein EJD97_024918 [Solanum chilense]
MSNGEIREALPDLAQSMTTYVNRGIEPKVNVVESTITSRLRDFVRMNPPIFLGSKVRDCPTISARGNKSKQDPPSVPSNDVPRLVDWNDMKSSLRKSLCYPLDIVGSLSGSSLVGEERVNEEVPPQVEQVEQVLQDAEIHPQGVQVPLGGKECTGNFFGCGKDVHKVRGCTTFAVRSKEATKDPLSVPGNDALRKNHFDALQARVSKQHKDEDVGKL